MSTASNPYRGFRFPAEIISEAVWLYHCFSLGLREVELILAARGIKVSYETIREWGLRFGRDFAKTLRRRRAKPGDKWLPDEVCHPHPRQTAPFVAGPSTRTALSSKSWFRAGATRRRPNASSASY